MNTDPSANKVARMTTYLLSAVVVLMLLISVAVPWGHQTAWMQRQVDPEGGINKDGLPYDVDALATLQKAYPEAGEDSSFVYRFSMSTGLLRACLSVAAWQVEARATIDPVHIYEACGSMEGVHSAIYAAFSAILAIVFTVAMMYGFYTKRYTCYYILHAVVLFALTVATIAVGARDADHFGLEKVTPYGRPMDGVLIYDTLYFDESQGKRPLHTNIGGEATRCEIWAHTVSGGSHTPAVIPPSCLVSSGYFIYIAVNILSFCQLIAAIVSQRIAVGKNDTHMVDEAAVNASGLQLDNIPLVENEESAIPIVSVEA